jgi:hypothetical protein
MGPHCSFIYLFLTLSNSSLSWNRRKMKSKWNSLFRYLQWDWWVVGFLTPVCYGNTGSITSHRWLSSDFGFSQEKLSIFLPHSHIPCLLSFHSEWGYNIMGVEWISCLAPSLPSHLLVRPLLNPATYPLSDLWHLFKPLCAHSNTYYKSNTDGVLQK